MFGSLHQVNYSGLRAKPNYAQLIDYLQNGQETIRYPDRFAKQMRNSPYMTQLDGVEIMTQQTEIQKAQDREAAIRALASTSGQTANELRAVGVPSSSSGSSSGSSVHSSAYSSVPSMTASALERHWRNTPPGTPVRPAFLPQHYDVRGSDIDSYVSSNHPDIDSYVSSQQEDIDEINEMLRKQDKRRLNYAKLTAKIHLDNIQDIYKTMTDKLVSQSASAADPSYVNPSSSAAGADPAYSSKSYEQQIAEVKERRRAEYRSG